MRKDKMVLFTASFLLLNLFIPTEVCFATENIPLYNEERNDSLIEEDSLLDTDSPLDSDSLQDVDSLQDSDSQKEPASYKESVLPITKINFVADSLNDVDAIYRPGKNDGSNALYSCSAFIKKYYKHVYDVSVYNLFAGKTPRTYEGSTFKSVKTPKVGDIAYAKSHWAIVKKVDKTKKQVVLIEQNWKYQLGGKTVCKINRTVSWSNLCFYRLNP